MEELKEKLLKICNESGLPLEAIVFVTKDLWRDAADTLERFKQQQLSKKNETSENTDKE